MGELSRNKLSEMLRLIKDFFCSRGDFAEKGPPSLLFDRLGEPTDWMLKTAAAVILVDVACSDGRVTEAELESICLSLEENLGLTQGKVNELIEVASAAVENRPTVREFVEMLSLRFTPEQREVIMELVWKVVLVDRKVDAHERAFVERLKHDLKLTDQQSERACELARKDCRHTEL